jgi:hypothetical protein
MTRTLLEIFEDLLPEIGLTLPSTVVGNTTQEVIQLLAMGQTLGQLMSTKYNWEEIERDFSFTAVAANEQGALTTVIGSDYRRLLPNTMWDSSTLRPIPPISREEYETALRSNITGVWLSHYVYQSKLYMMPAPPAGRTITGKYISTGWCETAGGTGLTRWADDTDVIRLDPTLYMLRLKERYLKARGLPYGETQVEADTYELNLFGQQREHNVLDMSGETDMRGRNPTAQIGGANWEDLATNWEELG